MKIESQNKLGILDNEFQRFKKAKSLDNAEKSNHIKQQQVVVVSF